MADELENLEENNVPEQDVNSDNGGGEDTQPEIVVKVSESTEDSTNWFAQKEEVIQESLDNHPSNDDNNDVIVQEEEDDDYYPPVDFDYDEEEFEVTEQEAFEALKKARGLEVESIDDLLRQKEGKKLSPELEKFVEFQEKTGNNNYNDFLATQKDWAVEEKNVVIKEFLKIDNPTLTDKQIDFLYNKNYSFDEDMDDEDVVMERQINIERDFQKGLKALEERKEQYQVVRGSDENIPQEYKEAKSIIEKLQQEDEISTKLFNEGRLDYVEKTNAIFDNFEGFKVKVGQEEFVMKPVNVQELKTAHSDIEKSFNQKYFDKETGKLKDPNGFHKALYFAMNQETVAEHFFNLGKTRVAEEDEKLSKNISPDVRKNVAPPGSSNISVKVVGS